MSQRISSRPEPATTDATDFVLDRDAEVPIGVQLAWGLQARIRDGRLQPGGRLPGLRELAEATGVNANTVRAVYQRLEHEGLVDCRQGSGTFVAEQPRRSADVGAIAANAAREARETGVDLREVAAALYVAHDLTRPHLDQDARRRRQLRDEIAVLERTLVELEAKHPGLLAKRRKTAAASRARLLTVQELESVQGDLIRRLAALQVAIDQLAKPTGAGGAPQRQAAAAPKRAAKARATSRPAPAGT